MGTRNDDQMMAFLEYCSVWTLASPFLSLILNTIVLFLGSYLSPLMTRLYPFPCVHYPSRFIFFPPLVHSRSVSSLGIFSPDSARMVDYLQFFTYT